MRDCCLSSKSLLAGNDNYTNVYVNADEDRETRCIKSMLRKIARHCRDHDINVSLRGTCIEIEDTLYDSKYPMRIPEKLRPKNLVISRRPPKQAKTPEKKGSVSPSKIRPATPEMPDPELPDERNKHQKKAGIMPLYQQITESGLTFYGARSVFSTLYPVKILHEDIEFHCAEQLYQWIKCQEMDDQQTADKVLRTKDGLEALNESNKCIGGKTWKSKQVAAMELTQHAKFCQNKNEREALIDTSEYPLILAENDAFWGGNAKYNDISYQTEDWDGRNMLGLILCELRDALISEGDSNHESGSATKAQIGEHNADADLCSSSTKAVTHQADLTHV